MSLIKTIAYPATIEWRYMDDNKKRVLIGNLEIIKSSLRNESEEKKVLSAFCKSLKHVKMFSVEKHNDARDEKWKALGFNEKIAGANTLSICNPFCEEVSHLTGSKA